MPAASKKGSDLGNIHKVCRAHAYLILQGICFIHEHRTFHAPDIFKLINDAVKVLVRYLLKFHQLSVHRTDDAASIQKQDAF